ncbi:hypothetical protein M8J77_006616 [Diaphorina citri]|nr:hypothetical protein M8J77_006616 [Diaphorina citri]
MLNYGMSNFDTPPPTPNPFENESEEDMEEIIELIDEDDIQVFDEDDGEDDSGLDDHFRSLNDAVSRGMGDLDEEMDMEGTSAQHASLDVPLIEFKKHKDSVFVCDIERGSGNLVVTGGQDDVAYVWNIMSGEICLVCEGHKDSVTHAVFSNDSKYLATGDMSGNIIVWSASSLTKVVDVQVEDILWLKWHTKANVLFAGVVDGCVYFWEIPSQKCKVIPGTGVDTGVGVIMPDGLRIAVGYNDGSVKVFNLKDLSVLHTIKTPKECVHPEAPILCMDAHPNNNLVTYGDDGGNVVVLQTQGGKVVAVFDGVCSVESILFLKKSSELNILVAGNTSGEIHIWDYARKVLRHKVVTEAGLSKLIFTEDESRLLASSLQGFVFVINVLSGSIAQTFTCHHESILDICFIPMISAFVTTSDDHCARVFELTREPETL